MRDLLFQAYIGWIMFGPMLCLYGIHVLWRRWRAEKEAREALEERVKLLEEASGYRTDWRSHDA